MTRLTDRVGESGRWFLFAVKADDRRRARYGRFIDRIRRAELEARRAALELLPPPSLEIRDAVGHVSCAGESLGNVTSVVDEVQRIRSTVFPATAAGGKPYLIDYPITELPSSSPLLAFALGADVVGLAAHYLGMVPILTGVTVLASPYVGGGGYSGSQLFHSDWEDRRQVKVFVHCSAVEMENGPLSAVTADASARVKRDIDYHYGGPSFRVPDDVVLPRLRQDDFAAFVGPAGSATLIDTSSCLHYGSRLHPGATERLVVQFQFLTPSAFDLQLAVRTRRPFAHMAGTFSPLERLVLGARRP